MIDVVGRAAVLVGAAASLLTVPARSQAVRVAAGDTARFTESMRATVTTYAGTSVRERRVARDARYTMFLSADTLVARADTFALAETVAGTTRQVDVDAVIGGRWKIGYNFDGPYVFERPFVPADIAEVSDLAVAMDDFLPPSPPSMSAGGSVSLGGRRWSREADSAGVQRYRWNERTTRDTTRLVADSVPLASEGTTRESVEMAWSAARGAVAWRRVTTSSVTTRVRGRVIRAEIEQVSNVRRDS